MILSSLTDELWQNTKPRIQINCCSWVYREFLFWRQLSNSLLGSSSSAKSASNFKISAHSGRFCLLTEHEKKTFQWNSLHSYRGPFLASLPSMKKSYWNPKMHRKHRRSCRHFYMRGKVANWPAVHSAQAAQPSRSASECENSVSWRAVFDQQRSTRFGPQIGRILGNSIKKGKSILLVGNEQKSFHESPWSLARRSPNFVRTLLVFSLI